MTMNLSAEAAPSGRIWLSCQVLRHGQDDAQTPDVASDELAAQVCARLKQQIEKTSGARVQLMTAETFLAGDGQRGANVALRMIHAHRADVELTSGLFADGVLQAHKRQSLQLDVQDGKLGVGAATALAHPLVQMLDLGGK